MQENAWNDELCVQYWLMVYSYCVKCSTESYYRIVDLINESYSVTTAQLPCAVNEFRRQS